MQERRRSFWGWGYEGEPIDESALAFATGALEALFGGTAKRREPPEESGLVLPHPRVSLPTSLEALGDPSPHARALCSAGRSYRDLARTTRGRFDNPPDIVARPRTENELESLLEHASQHHIAVIPFGGGTSVAGGVEPELGPQHRGSMSLDLRGLTGLHELDLASRSARIGAGTTGPAIEAALGAHGLSLRHYPQSFEISTLGGWIATRAGGHFATLYTHIDELVQSVRLVTPRGALETRRLPGSGAGAGARAPGAGLRGHARHRHRSLDARLPQAELPQRGHRTLRLTSRSRARGDAPRRAERPLPDELPLARRPRGHGERLRPGRREPALARLRVGRSPHRRGWRAPSRSCAGSGGSIDDEAIRSSSRGDGRDLTADTYKRSFFRAPYMRDELILRDVFVETYETAVVWSGVDALVEAVREAVRHTVQGPHLVTLRLTHVYPDGCAPYFTVIAPARVGREVEQWWELKHAVTSAIIGHGGTSTHHHAVGRDVVQWYERERPPLFDEMLRAAKRAVDPTGMLNPGVLFPSGR
jgi:alkyldihydroxyacetonephosphate synthase